MSYNPISIEAFTRANSPNTSGSSLKSGDSDCLFSLPPAQDMATAEAIPGATAESLYRFNTMMAKTALSQMVLSSFGSEGGMEVVEGYAPMQMMATASGSASTKSNTAAIKAYATASSASGSQSVAAGQAKRMAGAITSAYEGGGVAGDFDGQGLSLGVLQWNMGSGTLQPLLREMANQPASASNFDAIFSGTTDSGEKMSDVLRGVLNGSGASQLQFAKSINTEKNKIQEPWNTAFQKLLEDPGFEKIEEKYAANYIDKAARIMNDADVGVKTVRGYALAFDIAVQNGSLKPQAKAMVLDALSGKSNALTNPSDPSLTANQRQVVVQLQEKLSTVDDADTRKLFYTAAAVALTSNERYARDVWARKSTIVEGQGTVHGKRYDLEKTMGLSDQAIV